ncbi:hypothetical protein M707_21990 [Arthrobacter sp. AK-YN10]|nr:hypothetical protein M707_21990 [Arthrobacter sp. AK-YN10]
MGEYQEEQRHRLYAGTSLEGQAAIGRIAIWAASLEENLVALCVSLINHLDDVVGHAVTANMSASSMIQLAKRLAAESDAVPDEDKADVQAILTEAKAALEQRNMILHASLGEITIGGKSLFRRRRKRSPGAPGQDPHWENTLRGVDELDEIGARLFNVSEELWAYVNLPSPGFRQFIEMGVLELEPEQTSDHPPST